MTTAPESTSASARTRGGAARVVAVGAAGGFALSGRGPLAARVAAALLPVALVASGVAAQLLEPGAGVTTPRGAWVLVLLASSLAVACLAATIPFRRETGALGPDARGGADRVVAGVAVGHMSRTTSSVGRAQQSRTSPAAAGSSGSGA